MKWLYWSRTFNSKFQAGCLVKRMEEDWWVRGYNPPQEVEVFQLRNGKYGVRFIL
jgi:hypothetical protein